MSTERFSPSLKCKLKLFGRDGTKNAIKGVVRRNATREAKERLKKFPFGIGKKFHFGKVFNTANGGADGDNKNIKELMFSVYFFAWIFDNGEVFY